MLRIKNISIVLFLGLCLAQSLVLAQDYQSILSNLSGMSPGSAISTLEEWVSKHPNHAAARFQLARSYMGARQFNQAEDQLRTCMELSQAGSELHTNCIAALKEISESKYAGNYSGTASAASSSARSSLPASTGAAAPSFSAGSAGRASVIKQYGSLRNNNSAPQTLTKITPANAPQRAGSAEKSELKKKAE